MLLFGGAPAANAGAPIDAFGTELVFCDGGIVLSGGGVSPSDFMRSAEPFKCRAVPPSFCASLPAASVVGRLLGVPDVKVVAVAIVVAEILMARGVVVV